MTVGSGDALTAIFIINTVPGPQHHINMKGRGAKFAAMNSIFLRAGDGHPARVSGVLYVPPHGWMAVCTDPRAIHTSSLRSFKLGF